MKRIIIASATISIVLLMGQKAVAQTDEHKIELGALFTSITLDNFRSRALPGLESGDATIRGLGGRFSYNFTKHIALDAEGNFLPETHFGNEEFAQKLQGFVGVKVGARYRHVGIFAKVRPGVMWFGEFSSRGSCTRTTFGSVCGVAHEKDFALDLGGIIEVYPSQRAIIRFDIGDTIVHYQARSLGTFSNPLQIPADNTNNFQASVGFGYRF